MVRVPLKPCGQRYAAEFPAALGLGKRANNSVANPEAAIHEDDVFALLTTKGIPCGARRGHLASRGRGARLRHQPLDAAVRGAHDREGRRVEHRPGCMWRILRSLNWSLWWRAGDGAQRCRSPAVGVQSGGPATTTLAQRASLAFQDESGVSQRPPSREPGQEGRRPFLIHPSTGRRCPQRLLSPSTGWPGRRSTPFCSAPLKCGKSRQRVLLPRQAPAVEGRVGPFTQQTHRGPCGCRGCTPGRGVGCQSPGSTSLPTRFRGLAGDGPADGHPRLGFGAACGRSDLVVAPQNDVAG